MTTNQNAEEVRGMTQSEDMLLSLCAGLHPAHAKEIARLFDTTVEHLNMNLMSRDADIQHLRDDLAALQAELHDVRTRIVKECAPTTIPPKVGRDDFSEWVKADKKCHCCKRIVPHDDRNHATDCLWNNSRQALGAEGGEGATAKQRHVWDRDGERCVNCGAKDWMDDPECTPPDEGDR